eukprot:4734361-Pleurochrysis_carterae.AAC.1
MARTGMEWHQLPRGREDIRIFKAAYYETEETATADAQWAQAFLEQILAGIDEQQSAASTSAEHWID